MDKTFSITEIARHFSLPESTARYYCKRFASFLPIHGEGRRKRYGEKSLELIASIIEYMKQGKTASMVEEELCARFPRVMDVSVENSAENYARSSAGSVSEVVGKEIVAHSSYVEVSGKSKHSDVDTNYNTQGSQQVLQLLEKQTSAMQSIAASLSVLATQKEDMQRLEDAARTAKEENTLLREEVSVLQHLLNSSEKIHQDDLDQVRTWMGRLARSFNEKSKMDTEGKVME